MSGLGTAFCVIVAAIAWAIGHDSGRNSAFVKYFGNLKVLADHDGELVLRARNGRDLTTIVKPAITDFEAKENLKRIETLLNDGRSS